MLPNKTALVILQGDIPSRRLVDYLRKSADMVICADGAARFLYDLNIAPDLIIGDFDSIPDHLLTVYESARYLKQDDQDTTDGEKALIYCASHGFKKVNIIGALGGRLDHTLYNIELLKRLHRTGLSIVCYTETEKIYLANGKISLSEKPGTRISFSPVYGSVSNIDSRGLKWELNSARLEFGVFSSVSNKIRLSPAEISFPKGELLVIVEHSLI